MFDVVSVGLSPGWTRDSQRDTFATLCSCGKKKPLVHPRISSGLSSAEGGCCGFFVTDSRLLHPYAKYAMRERRALLIENVLRSDGALFCLRCICHGISFILVWFNCEYATNP